jgi:hypothetical protein
MATKKRTTRKPARTSAEWGQIFKEQKASGLTIAEFCKAQDIMRNSFITAKSRYNARKRRVNPAQRRRYKKSGILASQKGGITLYVGNVRLDVMSGFDGATLREVVESLSSPAELVKVQL